jgi:predicted HicB family RNase H-like nuclease
MRRAPYDPEREQLAARIPSSLHRAVKIAAFMAEVTLRDWVADALEAHLRRCQPRATSEPTPGESA